VKESARVTNELLIAIPKRFPARVARFNSGTGVGWSHVKMAIGHLRRGNIKSAIEILRRPMRFGVNGQGDIMGAITVRGLAVVLSVEVKIDDKQSQWQKNFERTLSEMGGCYVVAHSCDEGIRGIEKWLEGLNVC
jgi:hypothetical protein